MLHTPGNPVTAHRPGVLHSKKQQHWVETESRRYIPAPQESVIGVIVHRSAEAYRVDLGSAHLATLDALAFEGATKRNRPALKVGNLVYARVSLANRDMDPELECFDATTRKADGFGELKDGFMVECSLGTCRKLLDSTHFLLPALAQKFPFEVAVGVNGRVWVRAGSTKATIGVSRAIQMLDNRRTSDEEVASYIQQMDV
ncbi:hypothetical protein DACRYDRAFT_21427 [Dacryopinax primogenitus]|uniref:Ribosomal RNA-processing protein 40 n=1 Tax=Dacryopinax primogenitus (strain DJM 731) TaxID=1858805 RepID=M5G348_DACPD|nr:uncharacterized protein DACRYDRAFT_21427 [Dacryopinax primogenitus]EJU03124.1 hypothetical protein DACRYDRAFT_21427 [Dacryopinax primogenitus]